MEEETGKSTLVGGSTAKQVFRAARASTARKYRAVVTCIHTPTKFWARLGEGKGSVTRTARDCYCVLVSQPSR